jgi:hypothetical protein
MARGAKQVAQLQELLQDPALRKQIRSAPDQTAVLKRVTRAGDKVGFTFNEKWLKEAFDDVRLIRKPDVLGERELLALAGRGGSVADSENKLCHTDSCGGNHGGCC